MSEGRVEALYQRVKEMTVNFRLRPGERINEVALAKSLDASRTPLREALNRLVAERLIDFRPTKGFFCRDLDPQSIFELYELRTILEEASVRRACIRASDEDIAAVKSDLYQSGLTIQGKTVQEVTDRDEAFHMAIAKLADNAELVQSLIRINERIRFIRWIDMASRVTITKGEHKEIIQAMEERNGDRAADIMRRHIAKRKDQIVTTVKEGYSNIYVEGPEQRFMLLEEADG